MTLYRIYCLECEAQTVGSEADLEVSEWSVESLAFHEGRCPDCRGSPGFVEGGDEVAAADGGQPTLGEFVDGGTRK